MRQNWSCQKELVVDFAGPGEAFAGQQCPGDWEIIVFGSPSAAHSLMAAKLIDEYWLFVNPVLLGKGIPLFKNITDTTPLTLTDSKSFSTGVVCLHYHQGGQA